MLSILRYIILFSLLFGFKGSYAQSIMRSTISILGGSSVLDNTVVIQQTVGQPSPTKYRQGFIQPYLKFSNEKLDLQIYPIPSSDFITIANSKFQSTFSISNHHGSIIQGELEPFETKKVNILALPAGVYFITYGSPQYKVSKFIKVN